MRSSDPPGKEMIKFCENIRLVINPMIYLVM